MQVHEFLVVGSGCSGAMAAQTLVDSGAQVAMADVGETDKTYANTIPDSDFLSIRRTDSEQGSYLIGKEGEGIDWTDIGKGAQITPPRKHMVRLTDRYLSIKSPTFSPVESLGYGGLGISWGLQCWEYSAADMQAANLNPDHMFKAYETVSRRIGISGTKDGASSYTLGRLQTYQPSPHMDRNHTAIYHKYIAHESRYTGQGLHMGRTPLALITRKMDNRKAYAYRDMDFYSDQDKSAWRPWIAIDALRKRPNFTYFGHSLVLSFAEKKDYVEVTALQVDTNEKITFHCKHLILGAGTLGSARVVLRSYKSDQRLPLLCNPYTYVPCLQPRMIGAGSEKQKLGFAQLSLFLDEQGKHFDTSVASLYSYQSLMLFRTVRQLPFNFSDARTILQYIAPAIVIMGIHHPDKQAAEKYIRLQPAKTATGDRLQASYTLSKADATEYDRRERKLMSAMRRMGTMPIKRIDPGNGASIHYAGTLPFSDTEKPFTLSPQGRLHGTRNVYVADSSGFTYLPAQGLTFSLMANAHRIAEGLVH